MTRWMLKIGHYGFLVLLTLGACGVMWWVSRPSDAGAVFGNANRIASVPVAAEPKTPVYVDRVEPKWCDVTLRHSGKIQAWETYSLGFEIGGRVAELGENAAGEALDDGDRVEAGQLLARLDDRVLRALQGEAVANFELAASDMERSRRLRDRSPDAISEADFQADLTQMALMKARQEVVFKNLEDAAIISPISGSIVKRFVEVGESVSPNTVIFEIVQNHRLRLIVNVPESRIRELELRRRQVIAAKSGEVAVTDPEEKVFRARVQLAGKNVYGQPWPPINAEVYRIAEVADTTTGLFEVEVLIPNEEGLLRPGMVATAEIVTSRILAYEIPEPAVLFRSSQTYLFSVETEPSDMKVMFWDVGESSTQRAKRHNLAVWIDQGETVLLPVTSIELEAIVTRGQQRLRNGQLVRVLEQDKETTATPSADPQHNAKAPSSPRT